MRERRVPTHSPGVQFQSVNLPAGRPVPVQTSRGQLHRVANSPVNCDGHSVPRPREKSGHFRVLFFGIQEGKELDLSFSVALHRSSVFAGQEGADSFSQSGTPQTGGVSSFLK